MRTLRQGRRVRDADRVRRGAGPGAPRLVVQGRRGPRRGAAARLVPRRAWRCLDPPPASRPTRLMAERRTGPPPGVVPEPVCPGEESVWDYPRPPRVE